MTDLLQLWMPIIVSAVIVFIASSIIHMGPFWHKNDYPAPPQQDRMLEALRPFNLVPGEYCLPRADTMAEMSTPEFVAKLERGPVLMMTVKPNGPWSMGRCLTLWFIFSAVVSLFAGYIASRSLGTDAHYLRVFQVVGAAAFIGYALGLWQMWIWYGRSLGMTLKATFDGLIYACLTAGTFGWLWPN